MQFFDFMERIHPSSRIRIIRDDELIFQGYQSIFIMQMQKGTDEKKVRIAEENPDVEKVKLYTEFASKKWKEKGLIPPLDPEALPEYSFSDLNLSIFFEIHLL